MIEEPTMHLAVVSRWRSGVQQLVEKKMRLVAGWIKGGGFGISLYVLMISKRGSSCVKMCSELLIPLLFWLQTKLVTLPSDSDNQSFGCCSNWKILHRRENELEALGASRALGERPL